MMPVSQDRQVTLVWIDSRRAVIARWRDGAPILERLTSNVPAHRRSTGHGRRDPVLRSGGSAATADEPHRLEHRARFLEAVAARLPDDDLELVGPGTVREHLARVLLRDAGRSGAISTHAAGPMTDHQLVARARELVGEAPRRRPGSRCGSARRAPVPGPVVRVDWP